jgi:hypothetical protein
MLASGKADAFATDDVLLYGFIATAKNASDMKVVGEYLSYDPYGLVYRRLSARRSGFRSCGRAHFHPKRDGASARLSDRNSDAGLYHEAARARTRH